MKISNIKYKFLSRFFPNLVTSSMMVNYLKKNGIKVGKKTVFFDAGNICIDISRPILLHIGDYCKITSGTIILTHDYSRSVLRRVYGEIIAEAKETYIGNNVFIGMNSIILMGTKIGDNCIVGAGSVCSGRYPENSVIAGNPAKVIMTLEEYYNKRKSLYINEAKQYVELFEKNYNRLPSINEMGAFFPLYLERNIGLLKKNNLRTNLSGDDEKEILANFLNSKPDFNSFEDFLKECKYK